MSYKALVTSNLRRAFRQLKDLAKEVVFIGREEVGFNFATKTTNDTTALPVTIKAVVIKDDKNVPDVGLRKQQLMFQTKDVENIKTYDRVQIDGNEWLVGEDIFSDNYITLLEVYKQGVAL